ncbi:MAG: bifunctional 5,10-methylenetetrahydrofolate dehydrogenase/5,10-methenyltetrahydrofolate cyclohydrolase [Chloroflexi bacterium]|nr:bifunctional 5,10-methylenetetrahydrofolate dehydrogenase/5,10-methenyltetrahydrofolate cyclohydrolase [Chloroflexota bacterium]
MTARLLSGKPIADRVAARSKERNEALKRRGITPRLAIISVGTDPAASSYAGRLIKGAKGMGIEVADVTMPREITEQELRDRLDAVSRDRTVHGMLLLTPLPGALDELHVVDHITVEKDVEGMNPFSMGLLVDGRPKFIPSTAEAIVEMLRYYDIPLRGAHTVILGRSTVIGRPVASLLLEEDATITITHSRTVGLESLTRGADVVVVGVGKAGLIRGEMLKPGAVVIDAGINVTPTGIVGDVDTESVSAVASALSPVPGGVGAVTTALLLRNVITATEEQT